jgi:DNA-binding SARP family transcriptional activator
VQVRLLGPIDVMVGGAARPVSGRRRKAVLAVLGLRAGEVVNTDQLVDIVWGDEARATALNTLQRHVSYLRGMSGVRGLVVARGRGYMLDLEGDSTDVRDAETLTPHTRRPASATCGSTWWPRAATQRTASRNPSPVATSPR